MLGDLDGWEIRVDERLDVVHGVWDKAPHAMHDEVQAILRELRSSIKNTNYFTSFGRQACFNQHQLVGIAC